MSGLDNIIKHIEASATETATGMIEKAEADARKIIDAGKASADEKEAAIRKQGQADAQSAKKRIDSAADQALKRYILEAKQWEIDKTVAAALDKIQALPDGEYFDTMVKMVKKYAPEGEGQIQFSAADIARMPEGFAERVNREIGDGRHLEISDSPANINGGFILNYGDIEENCSLDALADSSKERLQDEISRILFD